MFIANRMLADTYDIKPQSPNGDCNRLIANRLLAALPRAEYRRLSDQLEPVALTFGQVLYEPGDRIRYVYFPNDSLVSLLTVVDAHSALEVGMVGPEGVVGTALALGVTVSPVRAVVQGTGTAMRMPAAPFLKGFRQALALQRGVHLYIHALSMQVARTAACNRFHSIDERLARWLLMTRDRVGSVHFHLTHEFLSDMLGVRREGVTAAAHGLKLRKLIDYSRGNIEIISGRRLEAAACSCYAPTQGPHK